MSYNFSPSSDIYSPLSPSRSYYGEKSSHKFWLMVLAIVLVFLSVFLLWIRQKDFSAEQLTKWSSLSAIIEFSKNSTNAIPLISLLAIGGVVSFYYSYKLYQ